MELLLTSKFLFRHKVILHSLCLALVLGEQWGPPPCFKNCSPAVQLSNLFYNGFPLVRFPRITYVTVASPKSSKRLKLPGSGEENSMENDPHFPHIHILSFFGSLWTHSIPVCCVCPSPPFSFSK